MAEVIQTGVANEPQLTEITPEAQEALDKAQESIPSETKQENSERPAGLPEGFETWEAYAKSLESKSETSEKVEGENQPETIQETADELGLDLEETVSRYIENDGFTDEDYAKFEAVGLTRDKVEMMVEGYKSTIKNAESEILETVGGEERFQKVTEWAKANLSSQELKAFNEAVSVDITDPSNKQGVLMAVSYLNSKYESAVGKDGNLLQGKNSTPSVQAYEDWSQVAAAVNDPRYKTSPAFRKEHDRKLMNSKL
tara:strand:- start:7274 stop:8041 length:768 start_codon:yes stop_codon:yes gene_type:complete